jgi:predicted phosphoribosyltransferase
LPAIEVADQNVILVDDGASPCSMIRDAIHLLRRQHAERVVVAVPAPCHHSACEMRLEADEVVTLAEPSSEYPASRWFEDIAPLSTEDVCHMLEALPIRQEAMN